MADPTREAGRSSNANTSLPSIDGATLDVFRSTAGASAAAGAARTSGERAAEGEPDPASAIPVLSVDAAPNDDRNQANEADGTTATSIPVAALGATSEQSEAAAEERSTEIPIGPIDETAVGDRRFADAPPVSDGSDSTSAAVTAEDREDSDTPGLSLGGSDSGTSNDILAGSDESSPEISDQDDQSQNPSPAITLGGSDSSPSDFNMVTSAEDLTGGDRDVGTGEEQTGRGDASEPRPSGRGSLDTLEALEIGTVPTEFQNPPTSISRGTPTGATPAGADTGVAGAVPITAVSGPPPVEEAPVDGPSLIPGRSSIPGDRMAGESAPGTLAPEVVAGSALDDPFGVDLPTGGSGAGSNPFGGGRLDLPGAPVAEDLGRGHVLDVGIDFNNLTGTGTLDGRGVDAFDGVGFGTGATGPADPGGVASEGGSVLSSLTSGPTEGTFLEWVGSLVGIKTSEEKSYDKASGVADAMNPAKDAEATEPAETTPTVTDKFKINLQSPKDQWNYIGENVPKDGHGDGGPYKGYWGARPSLMEGPSVPGSQDGLPPDHPDYVAPPGSVPPGSAVTGAIQQSVLQGLGGQRGGDVDPYDDPAGTTTGGAVQIDAYDSVVNPGPDGFMNSNVPVDESLLGGPLDAVAPYLDDE